MKGMPRSVLDSFARRSMAPKVRPQRSSPRAKNVAIGTFAIGAMVLALVLGRRPVTESETALAENIVAAVVPGSRSSTTKVTETPRVVDGDGERRRERSATKRARVDVLGDEGDSESRRRRIRRDDEHRAVVAKGESTKRTESVPAHTPTLDEPHSGLPENGVKLTVSPLAESNSEDSLPVVTDRAGMLSRVYIDLGGRVAFAGVVVSFLASALALFLYMNASLLEVSLRDACRAAFTATLIAAAYVRTLTPNEEKNALIRMVALGLAVLSLVALNAITDFLPPARQPRLASDQAVGVAYAASAELVNTISRGACALHTRQGVAGPLTVTISGADVRNATAFYERATDECGVLGSLGIPSALCGIIFSEVMKLPQGDTTAAIRILADIDKSASGRERAAAIGVVVGGGNETIARFARAIAEHRHPNAASAVWEYFGSSIADARYVPSEVSFGMLGDIYRASGTERLQWNLGTERLDWKLPDGASSEQWSASQRILDDFRYRYIDDIGSACLGNIDGCSYDARAGKLTLKASSARPEIELYFRDFLLQLGSEKVPVAWAAALGIYGGVGGMEAPGYGAQVAAAESHPDEATRRASMLAVRLAAVQEELSNSLESSYTRDAEDEAVDRGRVATAIAHLKALKGYVFGVPDQRSWLDKGSVDSAVLAAARLEHALRWMRAALEQHDGEKARAGALRVVALLPTMLGVGSVDSSEKYWRALGDGVTQTPQFYEYTLGVLDRHVREIQAAYAKIVDEVASSGGAPFAALVRLTPPSDHEVHSMYLHAVDVAAGIFRGLLETARAKFASQSAEHLAALSSRCRATLLAHVGEPRGLAEVFDTARHARLDCRRFMDGKEVRDLSDFTELRIGDGQGAMGLYLNKTLDDASKTRVHTELERTLALISEIIPHAGRALSVFVNDTMPVFLADGSEDLTRSIVGRFNTPPKKGLRCEFDARFIGQINMASWYKHASRVFIHQVSHAIYWKRAITDELFKPELEELGTYLDLYRKDVAACMAQNLAAQQCGARSASDIDEFLAKLAEIAYVPSVVKEAGLYGVILSFLDSDPDRTARIMRLVYKILGADSKARELEAAEALRLEAQKKVAFGGASARRATRFV